MNVIKFETNFKRKLFMHETNNISPKADIKNEENKLINIYPFIEFQSFIGFGRSFNSALLAIIYLLVQKKFLMI